MDLRQESGQEGSQEEGAETDLHDVAGQGHVPGLLVFVLHNEDSVEPVEIISNLVDAGETPGEDGRHEVDVLLRLGVVPPAEDRVRRGQD